MQEIILTNKKHGMLALIFSILGILLGIGVAIVGILISEGILARDERLGTVLPLAGLALLMVSIFVIAGLRVLKPNEALVLTLFGKYVGTLKGEGFYFINPFCVAVNPASKTKLNQSGDVGQKPVILGEGVKIAETENKKISLKIMTLNNNRQKINDCLGNPVEIGIAVMWKVVDTAKAVFNVDNYKEYLSLQCDSALRNIVRIYPYDVAPGVDTTGDGVDDDGSLRGSSEVVAARIRDEIQTRVNEAGIEMIVDGAVGMVEMALERLNNGGLVTLDEERKAAMVSNLLVVLCGNHDAQPIVNTGSLY